MSIEKTASQAHDDENELHELIVNSGSKKADATTEEVSSKDGDKPASETEEQKADVANESGKEEAGKVDQKTAETDTSKQDEQGKTDADTTSTFDSAKFLELSSEGRIKNEEDFKSTLEKLKEFETLTAEVTKLKEEKETIFANAKVRTLNEMYKAGKSEEQIQEFIRLTEIGDLKTLEPQEILVQGLIDQGVKRLIAEKMISQQYKLDDYSDTDNLTDAEKVSYDIALERMRLDAEPIAQKLSERMAEISSPALKEGKEVLEQAQKESYKKSLEPFANLLSNQFPKKFEYEANGEKLSYDVPKEEIEAIKQEAVDYFFDKEVNENTVAEFVEAKKWAMFKANGPKILADIAAQHDTIGYKRAKQEFENRTGLHTEERQPIVSSTKDAEAYAMEAANS